LADAEVTFTGAIPEGSNLLSDADAGDYIAPLNALNRLNALNVSVNVVSRSSVRCELHTLNVNIEPY
jgi:hypothetical protein